MKRHPITNINTISDFIIIYNGVVIVFLIRFPELAISNLEFSYRRIYARKFFGQNVHSVFLVEPSKKKAKNNTGMDNNMRQYLFELFSNI